MSFTSEKRDRTRPALPLAGMLDVMFLLLIFFMTASVFREAESHIAIALPTAEHAQPSGVSTTTIRISFDAQGHVYLGEREMSLSALTETLGELAKDFPGEIVEIRGDQQGQYGLAVHLMDVARGAGLIDIRLGVVKPQSQLTDDEM